MMTDCKDDKCGIKVNPEQSKQLRTSIMRILIPTPEQCNPNSWAFAASRKSIDEIMDVVQEFIIARLVEYVGEKK